MAWRLDRHVQALLGLFSCNEEDGFFCVIEIIDELFLTELSVKIKRRLEEMAVGI